MSDIAKIFAIAKMVTDKALTPAPVVILPETELFPASVVPGEGGDYYIVNTPFENTPTAGATGKLVWGGVEYTSKIVDVSALMKLPEGSFLAMGNLALDGGEAPEGVENPAPDAPYMLMIVPAGQTDETDGNIVYGQMMSQGITPEPPVLSIVQTEGASEDSGSDGGGVCTVNCSISTAYCDSTTVFSDADKTWAEVVAAHNAGMPVRIVAKYVQDTGRFDFVGDCCAAMIGTDNDYLVVSFPANVLCSVFRPFKLSNDGGALKFELFTD